MKKWVLLMTTAVAIASDCSVYYCKPEWMVWENSTCGYFYSDYFAYCFEDTCESGKVCEREVLNNPTSNYTCVDSQHQQISIYPGDRCAKGYVCKSDSACTSGDICPGVGVGEECDSSYCDPKLYCYSSYPTYECKNQKTEGSKCSSDTECQNHLGCLFKVMSGYTVGFCTPYFSLAIGDSVNSENYDSKEHTSNFCPYLTAYKTNDGTIKCSGPVVTNNHSPYSCLTDDDCMSYTIDVTDSKISSKCSCGYNLSGNKYCSLLPGDSYNFDALRWLKKWVETSIYRDYCSGFERLTVGVCAMNYWDHDNYIKASYYKMKGSLYPKVEGVPECILNTLYPEFYEIQQEFNKITMKTEEA